jgi:hypothetical protein
MRKAVAVMPGMLKETAVKKTRKAGRIVEIVKRVAMANNHKAPLRHTVAVHRDASRTMKGITHEVSSCTNITGVLLNQDLL